MKPSDIIYGKLKEALNGCPNNVNATHATILCILEYLDEEWEKNQIKCGICNKEGHEAVIHTQV